MRTRRPTCAGADPVAVESVFLMRSSAQAAESSSSQPLLCSVCRNVGHTWHGDARSVRRRAARQPNQTSCGILDTTCPASYMNGCMEMLALRILFTFGCDWLIVAGAFWFSSARTCVT